jgi:uroporphyrinogen-III synthase
MPPTLPLAGLNIVITRPREQTAQLIQQIEQAGGNTILFPLLEIAPVADPQKLREIVSRIHEFDLTIFISPNAVRYGMEAIRARGSLLTQLKIATIGQSSAQALRNLGVLKIITPQDRFDSESLLALPELQNVAGWRIVIFRGNGGRELLGETLQSRGASVEYAECYQRSKPLLDSAALIGQAPHAIMVTSSEALGNLWNLFDEQGKSWLTGIPLFVPHQRIAEAAQRLGVGNVVKTKEGDDGLLTSLVAWAQNRK